MVLPEKNYYRIPEVASDWGMEIEDVFHHFLQGNLRLGYRVKDELFYGVSSGFQTVGVYLVTGILTFSPGLARSWEYGDTDMIHVSGFSVESDYPPIFKDASYMDPESLSRPPFPWECGRNWLHSEQDHSKIERVMLGIKEDDDEPSIAISRNSIVIHAVERTRFERAHGITKIDGKNTTEDSMEIVSPERRRTAPSDYPLKEFQEMESLKFNEIKFRIDPVKYVLRISARGKEATVSFRAIGLFKKNEVTLNRQGKIFTAMANGSYYSGMPGAIRAISRLSALLRKAFNTPDPPFRKDKPEFRLSIPKDEDARQRAIGRTVPFDDNRQEHGYTNAPEFLEDRDPDFDPENPLYSDDFD